MIYLNPSYLFSAFSSAPPKPVGWANHGNDCCFISALQLMYHTPSWKDTLARVSAMRPFLSAYSNETPEALNIKDIRKKIHIPEDPTHAYEQTDPMEYIRAIAQAAGRTLNVHTELHNKVTQSTTYKTEQETPVLGLCVPKNQFFAPKLSKLMENYFDSDSPTNHVKKQLSSAPQDLTVCVQRFHTSRGYPLWKKITNLVLRLLQHAPLSASFYASKISSSIDMDFKLTLRPEWVRGAYDPVRYEAKSFICHQGSSIYYGHYITYVKTATGWWKCNDSHVEKVSESAAQSAIKKSYVVSYTKTS